MYGDEYITLLFVIELEQKWEDDLMSKRQQNELVRSSQCNEGLSCDHCAGVIAHEPWCITCNTVVRYAYEAVSRGSLLTLEDELILHALGVEWSARGL